MSEREYTQRLMTLNVVSNVADYVCKISRNLDRCVFSALWINCFKDLFFEGKKKKKGLENYAMHYKIRLYVNAVVAGSQI